MTKLRRDGERTSALWHGEKLSTLEVGGLALKEIFYPQNSRNPSHSHEFPYFLLVRNGSFTQRYRSKVHEYRPTTLIYMRSDETHADRFHNAGAHCFVIELGKLWRSRISETADLTDTVEFSRELPIWLVSRLYNEFRLRDASSLLAIEGLTLELAAEVSRNTRRAAERKSPAWLSDVKDMLQANFADHLTIERIAGSVGVHPVHLARVFRRHFNCTFGDYVRKLRIEFACREVISTDRSLTQIAQHAGFYDHSHFSKVFKQKTGLTPRAYRAASRRR